MKRLLKFGAALVILVVLVVLALPFLLDANQYKPLLEQRLGQLLGRTVTIGDLSLSLWSGGISASDLHISEDPKYGQDAFLSAKALNVGVDLRALILEKALKVEALTVDQANVALIQDAEGDWNFSSLGAAAPAPTPATAPASSAPAEDPVTMTVKLFRIAKSSVQLVNPSAKRAFTDVDFELRDVSANAAVPFSLSANVGGGGSVKLSGQAGPIAPAKTAETPFDAQVQIDGLDLAKSGFIGAGMGGILKFNGSLNSNGKTAALSGAVTIDQLKLSDKTPAASRPVAANLAVAHDLKTRRGNIAKSMLKLGSASATISGDYSLAGEVATVNAALNGSKMPVAELLPFLPVFGVELPTGAALDGGTLSVDATSRGAMNALTTAGSVKIEGAKLTGYNLGSKLRVIQDLAGIPLSETTEIQTAATKFETSNAGTTLSEILFLAPSIGQLTGDGKVTPQHALNFNMKAVVKTGGLLAAALQQRGETTTVPFFILGTAADPSFKADVKALANEKLQQVVKNPEGALKNAKEAVKTFQGIRDLFRKAPKQTEPAKQ
ncbi:MAG: hypothetical protein RL328_218 [Acidobacteriota bacterium]